jgi:probable HAF family extracellular repeat protein
VALLTGAAANAQAQAYTATDLAPIISALPSGFVSSSTAGGINSSGQVVGSSYSAVEGFKAFLYSGGTVTELGTLPGGVNSYARAINTSGQIVGAGDTGGGRYHAFLYSSGTMTDLGTLPGGTASYAYGINDSGQIAGYSDTTSGAQHAFLYSSGTMTDLGTLPGGTASYAYGINANGQVVGYAETSGGAQHAFLYSSGAMTDLGTLPGGSASYAYGINNSGQIVGYSVTGSGAAHAFLYSAGTMTDLGTLAGGSASYAYGINSSGKVVGSSYSSAAGFRAFLYNSGTMTDLNNLAALPAGGVLLQANAIDDSGSIAVYGGDAYLLTPGNSQLTGITIQTSPEGLQFSIDSGVVQIAPQTVYLTRGTHTVTVTATQAGAAGTQYVFNTWSDSGAASHGITVGTSAATYTAAFKTQYQLTTAALPGSAGTVSPASGQFYDSGTSVTVTATPNPPYAFSSWSGAVTGTSNPTSVTMNGPESVTASFVQTAPACQPTGDGAPSVADVQLMVNEARGTAPPANDLSGDGIINVVDIQIEVNAVLTLGCTAK